MGLDIGSKQGSSTLEVQRVAKCATHLADLVDVRITDEGTIVKNFVYNSAKNWKVVLKPTLLLPAAPPLLMSCLAACSASSLTNPYF